MKLGIQKYIYGRIIAISTLAFIIVALLLVINHLLFIPYLVAKTELTAVDWIRIGIDVYFVLVVGAFAVYWISRLYAERQHTEKLNQAMAASSPVGVYIMQAGELLWVNQRFQSITGYTEEELKGTGTLMIVHPP